MWIELPRPENLANTCAWYTGVLDSCFDLIRSHQHPYSLQRTRSPPGPCLPRRIGNMHLRNDYNLNGKDIDVHFSFLSRGIILWIELGDRVLCKEYGCNLQDAFRLIGGAITMTSWFGITCVRCGLVPQS